MKFKKLFVVCAIVAVAFALSGCFGSQKPTRYYTVVLPSAGASVDKTYPVRLLVKKATIDPAYRRNNIVYRESPYDFMFYNYSSWATRPEYLIEQAVSLRVEQVGLFQYVENTPTAKPDYELSLHVIAVEEIDGDKGREAHLAMNISFRKAESDGDLWSKRFDSRKSYDGDDMREFATAISQLLENYTNTALQEIQKILETVSQSKE